MKRKVQYVVEPLGGALFGVNNERHGAAHCFTGYMNEHGFSMPTVPYKLVYTLAPKLGKILAKHSRCSSWMGVEICGDWSPNCLVPDAWDGLRFNRKVTIL